MKEDLKKVSIEDIRQFSIGKSGFTRLVNPLRSGWDSFVRRWRYQTHNPRIPSYHSSGFTLAETLITLTILGIVAAITVPALVRRQQEVANRTKIKKAVGVYESMITKLTVQNNLKSNTSIQEWADADCSNSSDLFKVTKFVSTDNKCKFKTADGVYWDITNLQTPIIALKEEDLTDTVAQSDTNRAFYLYAEYDSHGVLKVTEPNYAYTLNLADKAEVDASVDRLWAFMKGETNTSQAEVAEKVTQSPADKLKACMDAKETSCQYCITEDNCKTYNLISPNGETCSKNMISRDFSCTSTPFYISQNPIESTTFATNSLDFIPDTNGRCAIQDTDPEAECSMCTLEDCKNNGDKWLAAKYYCKQQGGRLPTPGELSAAGYTSGNFWTSGYTSTDVAYYVNYNTARTALKNYAIPQAVCVGNE